MSMAPSINAARLFDYFSVDMGFLLTFLASAFLFNSFAVAHPLPKRDLFLPVPHDDPFYDAPENLKSLKPGEIYNKRDIVPELEYLGAKSVVQVAYRTTDTFGNASHTVATVFTPRNPNSKAQVFSYQFWEDSDNIDCSPSYSLYGGLATPDGITASLDTAIFIDWAMSKGYYVVAADHEGPKSTFLAGFNEGYAGIDGIRAALSQLSLSDDTPIALYGYSGGGHATVWMTDLVGTYAPELNIIGAAHGGTPVDPRGTMQYLDGRTFSGFVLGAFAGLLNAYPSVKEQIWPLLTDTLKNDLNTVWSNNTCVLTEILVYGHTEFHTMSSISDFYDYPPILDIFENESLLANVSSHKVATPKFPRYIFHANGDEIIPNNLIRQYVSQQCAAGANIQFVEWPGGEHVTTEYLGIPNAMQFLQQAFEGKTPSVPCGSASQDILTLTSDGVGSIIGQGVVDAIKALDGVLTPLGKIVLNL